MKRVKVSLGVLAIFFALSSAFTTKTITYTDATGSPITLFQYLACPAGSQIICGIKYDDGVEVEIRCYDE
jgi:hypothetical protein